MTPRWPIRYIKAALLVGLVAACSSPVGIDDDSDAPIRTDRLRYQFQPAYDGVVVEIPYTFTNTTDAPVFIANCRGETPVRLEKRIDGSFTLTE